MEQDTDNDDEKYLTNKAANCCALNVSELTFDQITEILGPDTFETDYMSHLLESENSTDFKSWYLGNNRYIKLLRKARRSAIDWIRNAVDWFKLHDSTTFKAFLLFR
eukprot:TRINITY_DN17555_c0_g1_i1.p1 TRINITY_DN17555_c0_g1~~TRINITY_DN17555_c0_g1_i1.p1  ORF type:complete len:107 (-),score=8.71 TRINITY_DN17555_c0_g1_i1:21-341(-)